MDSIFKTDNQGKTWVWIDESYCDAGTGYNWVSEGHWELYTAPEED